MLRLNQRQRILIADTLRQLANGVAVAGIGSQFIADRRSAAITAFVVASWWVLLAAAVALTGDKDRG